MARKEIAVKKYVVRLSVGSHLDMRNRP